MSISSNSHKIYLFDSPFDEKSVLSICQQIDEANKNPEIKEIVLVINSGGGGDSCIALHDYIKISAKPIDTLVCGFCASAAVTVLQAGRKRYATKNSKILIHQGNGNIPKSSINNLQLELELFFKGYDLMSKISSDRIGISIDKWKEMTSFENLMTAKEALDLNFIDEII